MEEKNGNYRIKSVLLLVFSAIVSLQFYWIAFSLFELFLEQKYLSLENNKIQQEENTSISLGAGFDTIPKVIITKVVGQANSYSIRAVVQDIAENISVQSIRKGIFKGANTEEGKLIMGQAGAILDNPGGKYNFIPGKQIQASTLEGVEGRSLQVGGQDVWLLDSQSSQQLVKNELNQTRQEIVDAGLNANNFLDQAVFKDIPYVNPETGEVQRLITGSRSNVEFANAAKIEHVDKATGKITELEITPELKDAFNNYVRQAGHDLDTRLADTSKPLEMVNGEKIPWKNVPEDVKPFFSDAERNGGVLKDYTRSMGADGEDLPVSEYWKITRPDGTVVYADSPLTQTSNRGLWSSLTENLEGVKLRDLNRDFEKGWNLSEMTGKTDGEIMNSIKEQYKHVLRAPDVSASEVQSRIQGVIDNPDASPKLKEALKQVIEDKNLFSEKATSETNSAVLGATSSETLRNAEATAALLGGVQKSEANQNEDLQQPIASQTTPQPLGNLPSVTAKEINQNISQSSINQIEEYKKSLEDQVPDEFKAIYKTYTDNHTTPNGSSVDPDNYVAKISGGQYQQAPPELADAMRKYDNAIKVEQDIKNNSLIDSVTPQTSGEMAGLATSTVAGLIPGVGLVAQSVILPAVDYITKKTVDATAEENLSSYQKGSSPLTQEINTEKDNLASLNRQLVSSALGTTSLSTEEVSELKNKITDSQQKIADLEKTMRETPYDPSGTKGSPSETNKDSFESAGLPGVGNTDQSQVAVSSNSSEQKNDQRAQKTPSAQDAINKTFSDPGVGKQVDQLVASGEPLKNLNPLEQTAEITLEQTASQQQAPGSSTDAPVDKDSGTIKLMGISGGSSTPEESTPKPQTGGEISESAYNFQTGMKKYTDANPNATPEEIKNEANRIINNDSSLSSSQKDELIKSLQENSSSGTNSGNVPQELPPIGQSLEGATATPEQMATASANFQKEMKSFDAANPNASNYDRLLAASGIIDNQPDLPPETKEALKNQAAEAYNIVKNYQEPTGPNTGSQGDNVLNSDGTPLQDKNDAQILPGDEQPLGRTPDYINGEVKDSNVTPGANDQAIPLQPGNPLQGIPDVTTIGSDNNDSSPFSRIENVTDQDIQLTKSQAVVSEGVIETIIPSQTLSPETVIFNNYSNIQSVSTDIIPAGDPPETREGGGSGGNVFRQAPGYPESWTYRGKWGESENQVVSPEQYNEEFGIVDKPPGMNESYTADFLPYNSAQQSPNVQFVPDTSLSQQEIPLSQPTLYPGYVPIKGFDPQTGLGQMSSTTTNNDTSKMGEKVLLTDPQLTGDYTVEDLYSGSVVPLPPDQTSAFERTLPLQLAVNNGQLQNEQNLNNEKINLLKDEADKVVQQVKNNDLTRKYLLEEEGKLPARDATLQDIAQQKAQLDEDDRTLNLTRANIKNQIGLLEAKNQTLGSIEQSVRDLPVGQALSSELITKIDQENKDIASQESGEQIGREGTLMNELSLAKERLNEAGQKLDADPFNSELTNNYNSVQSDFNSLSEPLIPLWKAEITRNNNDIKLNNETLKNLSFDDPMIGNIKNANDELTIKNNKLIEGLKAIKETYQNEFGSSQNTDRDSFLKENLAKINEVEIDYNKAKLDDINKQLRQGGGSGSEEDLNAYNKNIEQLNQTKQELENRNNMLQNENNQYKTPDKNIAYNQETGQFIDEKTGEPVNNISNRFASDSTSATDAKFVSNYLGNNPPPVDENPNQLDSNPFGKIAGIQREEDLLNALSQTKGFEDQKVDPVTGLKPDGTPPDSPITGKSFDGTVYQVGPDGQLTNPQTGEVYQGNTYAQSDGSDGTTTISSSSPPRNVVSNYPPSDGNSIGSANKVTTSQLPQEQDPSTFKNKVSTSDPFNNIENVKTDDEIIAQSASDFQKTMEEFQKNNPYASSKEILTKAEETINADNNLPQDYQDYLINSLPPESSQSGEITKEEYDIQNQVAQYMKDNPLASQDEINWKTANIIDNNSTLTPEEKNDWKDSIFGTGAITENEYNFLNDLNDFKKNNPDATETEIEAEAERIVSADPNLNTSEGKITQEGQDLLQTLYDEHDQPYQAGINDYQGGDNIVDEKGKPQDSFSANPDGEDPMLAPVETFPSDIKPSPLGDSDVTPRQVDTETIFDNLILRPDDSMYTSGLYKPNSDNYNEDKVISPLDSKGNPNPDYITDASQLQSQESLPNPLAKGKIEDVEVNPPEPVFANLIHVQGEQPKLDDRGVNSPVDEKNPSDSSTSKETNSGNPTETSNPNNPYDFSKNFQGNGSEEDPFHNWTSENIAKAFDYDEKTGELKLKDDWKEQMGLPGGDYFIKLPSKEETIDGLFEQNKIDSKTKDDLEKKDKEGNLKEKASEDENISDPNNPKKDDNNNKDIDPDKEVLET